MALTPVTITGTFLRPDGSPMTGTGTAILSHRLVNGSQVIEPTPISLHLSPTGTVVNSAGTALILEANDDPATEPQGSTYEFALQFDSAPLDPFEAVVSHLAGTVDLSTLIPPLP